MVVKTSNCFILKHSWKKYFPFEIQKGFSKKESAPEKNIYPKVNFLLQNEIRFVVTHSTVTHETALRLEFHVKHKFRTIFLGPFYAHTKTVGSFFCGGGGVNFILIRSVLLIGVAGRALLNLRLKTVCLWAGSVFEAIVAIYFSVSVLMGSSEVVRYWCSFCELIEGR